MADWILNFTKGGVKHKKQLSAQARELLDVGLWGVPNTAQARDKLAPGDRVLVYIGAPERVFIGQATIASGWHEWSSDEAAKYPLTSAFGVGITLSNAESWPKPVPLSLVWPGTDGAKTNPKALWYGAAIRVTKDDYEAILQAGHTGTVFPASAPTTAPAPTPSPLSKGLPESDALFRAANRLREYLADPKPLNEASTRAFFLDRIFEALGYTEFADIEHGSVVQSGGLPGLRAALRCEAGHRRGS